jgi:hypothetical protein
MECLTRSGWWVVKFVAICVMGSLDISKPSNRLQIRTNYFMLQLSGFIKYAIIIDYIITFHTFSSTCG